MSRYSVASFSYQFIRLLAITVMLTACGGGGGGSNGDIADDNVNGIWQEPASGTTAMISGNGWDVDIILGSGAHLSGRLLARDGVIYDSIVSLFRAGQLNDVLFAQEGSVIPRVALDVRCEGRTTIPVSLNMTYDPLSDRTPSWSIISGICSKTSGQYTITITIDGSGSLFGSDTNGCTYTGNVTTPMTGLNIYSFSLDRTLCAGDLQDGRGQGILMDTIAANDTLLFAVRRTTEPSATDSIVMELYRQ